MSDEQQRKVYAREVDRLESFIRERGDDKTYLIDGDRDDDRSTICRRDGRTESTSVSHVSSAASADQASPITAATTSTTKGMTSADRSDNNSSSSLECLKLRLASTKLFAEMQRLGYFCILPQGKLLYSKTCRSHETKRETDAWLNRDNEERDGVSQDLKTLGWRPVSGRRHVNPCP